MIVSVKRTELLAPFCIGLKLSESESEKGIEASDPKSMELVLSERDIDI